ncbi:MAG: hypothetical protein BWY57_00275 [Betaproteobacteria bacterium ADurb.Bin341]|nr:MAG: hypothetical protein BWY57_00275 [Betaproteobacteria bacterium ADurb.Bin341]
MRIGIDFDNTIVSYDSLFFKVAIEQGAVPADTPVNKVAIRDYLRRIGKEDVWTEMQGYVYGARMEEAEAYPGFFDALRQLLAQGHTARIVSHKTKHPFIGPKYDLHAAARTWVAKYLQPSGSQLIENQNIYFELTKAEKISRIAALECDLFIDDLPEILLAEQFPPATQRLLFDPEACHSGSLPESIDIIRGWNELPAWIDRRT